MDFRSFKIIEKVLQIIISKNTHSTKITSINVIKSLNDV